MPKLLHDIVHTTNEGETLAFAAGDDLPSFLDFGKSPRTALKHLLSPEDLEAYLAPPPAPEPAPEPEHAPVSAEDPE